jgi:hypothetical protein
MDATKSPELEALERIESAIRVFEEFLRPGRNEPVPVSALSAMDTYRKLVKEAAALRAAVASQKAGEPVTKRLRVDAEEEIDPL